jgi:hypothetical protein
MFQGSQGYPPGLEVLVEPQVGCPRPQPGGKPCDPCCVARQLVKALAAHVKALAAHGACVCVCVRERESERERERERERESNERQRESAS